MFVVTSRNRMRQEGMIARAMSPQSALINPARSLVDGPIAPGMVRSREFVLTEIMRPGEPVAAVFQRLAAGLRAGQGELLGVMIYGAVAHHTEISQAMTAALGVTDWPVTWVEGASCVGTALAGVQAFALSGRPVTRIRVGGQVVGSVFVNGEARHCLLGGLGPRAIGLSPTAQLQQTFANVELALELAGLELADVVRTWFYNDNILAWYDEFNRVRSALYAGVPWRTGSLPASTGIGARNPAGAALQVALWAVRPHGATSCVREIASPLQCPAPAYGSSFSRAMEITSGGLARLLISGTASIHPGGETAWVGDVRKQIDLTMEVVAAILQERGMNYGDVTRATAYYRRAEDRQHFAVWQAERDGLAMPVVDTHSVVCRDDLLFEIELDACQAIG